MIAAVVRTDGSGRVAGIDAAARTLLGPVVGAACADAVRATDPTGTRAVCTSACAFRLAHGESEDAERAVRVRGGPCLMRCLRVGGEVVVLLRPAPVPVEALTPRERTVLSLVARGASGARAAAALGVKESTIRTHVDRAREKLGARTRAEAVARAIELGAISVEP